MMLKWKKQDGKIIETVQLQLYQKNNHTHMHIHTAKDWRDMYWHSYLGNVPVHDFSCTLYPIFSTFSLENVHYFYDEKLNFIIKK